MARQHVATPGRRLPRRARRRSLRKPVSRIVHWADLSAVDRKAMTEIYDDRVFPVLTPLAVDPSHPFPYISDLALSIAAFVRDPDTGEQPIRPRQGPRPPAPPGADRRQALHAGGGPRHRPPRHAVRRHGDRGGGGVPGHPQRRPHGRGGGGRRPARSRRDGAPPAPVQPRGAPRGRRRDERRDARPARPRARTARERRVPRARPDRPARACGSFTRSTAPTSRTGRGRRWCRAASPRASSPSARSCR